VAVTVAGFAVLVPRGLPLPGAGELAELLARNVAVAALLGAFGVGIGALVRNQVVALVGLLLLAFAVEPAVLSLAPDVGRLGPTGGLTTAVSGVPPEDVGMGDADLLGPWAAAAALLGWVAAAFALSGLLLRRRDLQ
jgi:ABC-2 type transport system permease protein